jgi:molybdenum cofactor synthesis domain-containing protein
MKPIRATMPIAEAIALIQRKALPIERIERVPLQQADGRVIAETVVAAADVPPFDRSAMDGYAVRAEDTFGASRGDAKVLRCVEVLHTGRVSSRTVGAGECVQIATGAPLPAGASAVVMVEETERGPDGAIRIMTPVYPRQNVSPHGSDLSSGATVLAAGQVITPSRLGALAATGAARIDVYARPIVAIISTGDEVVDPGQPLRPGQIYDINRFTLSAVVRRHGGVPEVLATAADTLDDLHTAIDAASAADIVVFSGGSSVGEKDLVLDLVRARGEVFFHGIAVKPGKPTLFGRIGDTLLFGMPGNPTSCLSNAYLLLTPLLRRIARLPEYTPRLVTLPLSRRIVSTTGRHQFYTVKIVDGSAAPAFKSSGDITSMSQADGYIEIPTHTDIVEAGQMVDVKLFQE